MKPLFFDIHAHLSDARFNEDRNDVFARMHEEGVWSIQIGTDHKSSQHAVIMAAFADSGAYAAIGVHPNDDRSERFNPAFFEDLLGERVVAIGECGLDYSQLGFLPDANREKERQKELFVAQVDFAVAHNLPLILHVRDSDKLLADAHHDILSVLKEKKTTAGDRLRGDVHFFSQTLGIAQEYFALGFTVSFTGVITFSDEYDEVVKGAPIDMIMAETDSPYAAPVPYRGKRNEPIFVKEVVRRIAEIRGEDFEVVRKQLVENALRVFGIK